MTLARTLPIFDAWLLAKRIGYVWGCSTSCTSTQGRMTDAQTTASCSSHRLACSSVTRETLPVSNNCPNSSCSSSATVQATSRRSWAELTYRVLPAAKNRASSLQFIFAVSRLSFSSIAFLLTAFSISTPPMVVIFTFDEFIEKWGIISTRTFIWTSHITVNPAGEVLGRLIFNPKPSNNYSLVRLSDCDLSLWFTWRSWRRRKWYFLCK